MWESFSRYRTGSRCGWVRTDDLMFAAQTLSTTVARKRPLMYLRHANSRPFFALWSVLVGLLSASWHTHAWAEEYVNRPFNFSLRIPKGTTVCRSAPPAPNHGVVIRLIDGDCSMSSHKDAIQIFATYNMPYEARSSYELGKHICSVGRASNSGFIVSGYRVLRCSLFGNHDEISRVLFFLADMRRGDVVTWRVFQIRMSCSPTHLRRGERLLRKLISNMKIEKL